MRIGPVHSDSPFLLAPLAGVSDSPFRRLAREQGASIVYTEMVSADGLVRGNQATLDYCAFDPVERPIGVQLFGANPDVMADAARRLCDLPAERRPDLIDINMGCPVRKVVNRSAGAALLKNVPLLQEIVRKMAIVSTVPVTAKVRLGWDGGSQNVVEVAKALEAAGAGAVAIHARTRAEKFEGAAHWEMIGAAKRAVSIPVIGNGDVRTPADLARLRAHTGCDAVMIGRAAIGNPWIFAGKDRSEVTLAEKAELMRRHLALNLDFYGPQVGLVLFRKHAAKYIHNLPGEAQLRIPLLTCATVAEFDRLLSEALESSPEPALALA